MDEEKHYPGQEAADAAPTPSQEATPETPEGAETPAPVEETKPEEGAGKPEGEKPEEETPAPDPTNINRDKKKSVYDDLKEERAARQAAEARAAAAEAANAAGTSPEPAPAPTAEVKDELEKYAEEHKLDAAGLKQLTDIIVRRAGANMPSREQLETALSDIDAWKADRARQEEEKAVRSRTSYFREQLAIHNDDEVETVMAEVIKLSQTEEFKGKEPEYILFRKRDELSKLVSPKRKSFESGDARPEPDGAADRNYDGRVTPEQMTQEVASSTRTSGYEISRSR